MHKLSKVIIVLSALILVSCGERYEQKGSADYIQEIKEWDQKRTERLMEDDGWLNLVGLFWLEEGDNTFGSDPDNDLRFPKTAPQNIGTFNLTDSVVTVKIDDDVDVLIDSQKINEKVLVSDLDTNTTIMSYGSLRWYLIKREGEMYGIRLRDLNAQLVKEFEGIERFPVNEDWKIEANWVPLDPPKELIVPNIIGTTSEAKAYGRLDFEIENESYSLYPTGKKSLFVIFADQTSGVETYGAGRFLSAEGPDSNNIVILDFNKAYNPPCVFTKYATCPLPPKENQLKVRITAGEKNYGEDH